MSCKYVLWGVFISQLVGPTLYSVIIIVVALNTLMVVHLPAATYTLLVVLLHAHIFTGYNVIIRIELFISYYFRRHTWYWQMGGPHN